MTFFVNSSWLSTLEVMDAEMHDEKKFKQSLARHETVLPPVEEPDTRALLPLCDEPERFVGACREAVRDEYDLLENAVSEDDT